MDMKKEYVEKSMYTKGNINLRDFMYAFYFNVICNNSLYIETVKCRFCCFKS